MRAFLSHSSVDKEIVITVYDRLEKHLTWIDRAEIEWGDLFLEKISQGIKDCTDFVLFWSSAAAKSEFVRLEINMAFIQALRHKAIRFRVVLLDDTPLPLHLQPFHAFSFAASRNPANEIKEKLLALLRQPVRSARSRFVDRHDEIARVEAAVDDPQFYAVVAFGFMGAGKSALVREALPQIFEGAEPITIQVSGGTGFVEFALALNASARNETLPESLSREELESQIRLSIETIAKDRRLLVVLNVQHWLDEDGEAEGPLQFLLNVITNLRPFADRPAFFTSTRRPTFDAVVSNRLAWIHVSGLSDEHIATLVRTWHFSIHGKEILPDEARRIAPHLFGHPVAARMAAGLLGDYGVEYLEQYPRELIKLRRDLARVLLQDLKLGSAAERLMETLALSEVGLPAPIIAASGFSDEEFQEAVDQCARAGIITADARIQSHPLFQEFFWHRLHRIDYKVRALQLAETIKKVLPARERTSPEYAELLRAAFRLFALGGNLAAATALRRDLKGELEATAVLLYNRRNYELADQYIQHVLDEDPGNWRMRLYRARVRIRQEDWGTADGILEKMLKERSRDTGVLHAMGWRQLREGNLSEALKIFTEVISRKAHVASLRDAAECLHRMNRNPEALQFLRRAKEQESENPFVLDLESRILEDMDQLEPAYDAALLASARDPLNAQMQNRLGVIRSKQGKAELAIDHFQRAMELDADWFSPVNSLVSAYLDTGNTGGAEELLPDLEAKTHTPANRALTEHAKARILFKRGDLAASEKILKQEIAASRNLVPNPGVLAEVEIALFDQNVGQFPATAAVALKAAEYALERIESLDLKNKFIDTLRMSILIRK